MPEKRDLTGARFGRWHVIREDGRSDYEKVMWRCRCECGAVRRVAAGNLLNGMSKSCGCFNLDRIRQPRKHGMSKTREFKNWQLMLDRCNNKNSKSYPRYGGRGIKVCDRWLTFVNFLADMGDRPKGLMLERINNNGNYEPKNCRWATNQEQQRNKRSNRVLSAFGKSQLLCEWVSETGISAALISYHLKTGKSLEQVIKKKRAA